MSAIEGAKFNLLFSCKISEDFLPESNYFLYKISGNRNRLKINQPNIKEDFVTVDFFFFKVQFEKGKRIIQYGGIRSCRGGQFLKYNFFNLRNFLICILCVQLLLHREYSCDKLKLFAIVVC